MKQLKDNGIKALIKLVKSNDNELRTLINGKANSNHTHSNYSLTTHNHDSVYSKLNHTHSYAASSHNHDDRYLKLDGSNKMTGPIWYRNTNNNHSLPMIDFVPGNDNTGDGIIIGNGGLLALNGGEAYRNINGVLNNYKGEDKHIVLATDETIDIYTGVQQGTNKAAFTQILKDGTFTGKVKYDEKGNNIYNDYVRKLTGPGESYAKYKNYMNLTKMEFINIYTLAYDGILHEIPLESNFTGLAFLCLIRCSSTKDYHLLNLYFLSNVSGCLPPIVKLELINSGGAVENVIKYPNGSFDMSKLDNDSHYNIYYSLPKYVAGSRTNIKFAKLLLIRL